MSTGFPMEVLGPCHECVVGEARPASLTGAECGIPAPHSDKPLIDPANGRGVGFLNPERAAAMCSMYEQGCTLEQIGAKFGVTRERVRQIIRKLGVTRYDGGVHVQAKARANRAKADARVHAETRALATFGCSYDLVRELRAKGATAPFKRQRRSAKLRGIEWRLTLQEWWAVWQASGKWSERGRGDGLYVMSRIKDSGPYALGNVHIQTHNENSRDAVEKWCGKTKPLRGVFFLYPGREKAWKATFKNKSLGFFATAEEAAAARLSAQMRAELEGLV